MDNLLKVLMDKEERLKKKYGKAYRNPTEREADDYNEWVDSHFDFFGDSYEQEGLTTDDINVMRDEMKVKAVA